MIRLHSAQAAANLPPIHDPDPLISCDLMDGRDALLTLARDKHYEFSSLRRAKFSSIALLYELHNQGKESFVYNCNKCDTQVETRWHCTVCDVSIKLTFYSCRYREGYPDNIVFLFIQESTDCGYSLEVPQGGASSGMGYHYLFFHEK